jgi:hypothetical protein
MNTQDPGVQPEQKRGESKAAIIIFLVSGLLFSGLAVYCFLMPHTTLFQYYEVRNKDGCYMHVVKWEKKYSVGDTVNSVPSPGYPTYIVTKILPEKQAHETGNLPPCDPTLAFSKGRGTADLPRQKVDTGSPIATPRFFAAYVGSSSHDSAGRLVDSETDHTWYMHQYKVVPAKGWYIDTLTINGHAVQVTHVSYFFDRRLIGQFDFARPASSSGWYWGVNIDSEEIAHMRRPKDIKISNSANATTVIGIANQVNKQ